MTNLRYALWSPGAREPIRKHETDAGVDVFANEDVWIPPFSARKVKTGLSFEIRPGTMLLAKPKSGQDYMLGAGVLDALYQGEVLIKVINYKPWPIRIRKGSPVAQLISVLINTNELERVEDVRRLHGAVSARGADGGIVRE